jgi:hypothetical protein
MATSDNQDEVPSFYQDQHDHPLPLLYSGDKCNEYVDMLAGLFGEDMTFKLTTSNVDEVMGELMPLHFQHHHQEYFAYATTPQGTFIAFNHLFHDAYSAGLLMKNNSLVMKDGSDRSCYIPPNMIKIPYGSHNEPDFIPVKTSVLHVKRNTIQLLKAKYGMTQNEVAFLITCTVLSKQIDDDSDTLEIACLHNMRRYFGAEGKLVGGDYTCSTDPLVFDKHDESSSEHMMSFPSVVKHHFEKLKEDTTLVTQDLDSIIERQTRKCWIFDTWINADLGRPGKQPSESFQLRLPELMKMFSVVCRNFVVVADVGDDFIFTFFSDEIKHELTEEELAQCWL